MNTLILKNKFRSNATLLTNDFIDVHMPKANGEFVKVYLFLLRHIDNLDSIISVPTIADRLNNTEKDIIRAIKYWENQGLLSLVRDSDENIVNLEFSPGPIIPQSEKVIETISVTPTSATPMPTAPAPVATTPITPTPATPPPSAAPEPPIPFKPYKAKKTAEEYKAVVHFTEMVLGRSITSSETESISYLFYDLDMSSDLFEYLVGSCVDNGNRSFAYIYKVALEWHDKGIRTVEEAKFESMKFNKIYSTVIKALGIINRGLTKREINYIDKWINHYNFCIEIIEEACNRTIENTSQPRFKYLDGILKSWHNSGVASLEDVHKLDKQHSKEGLNEQVATGKYNSKSSPKNSSKTKSNYEKREFDYDTFTDDQIKARKAARNS